MSQSQAREEMLENIEDYGFLASSTQSSFLNELAIGHPSGFEVLLPKYSISTGRDGETEAISQARIYLEESEKWFNRQDLKFSSDVEVNGKAFVGFLLSSVQESRSEKVQTTPLNGDNYSATFYGESPTVYAFQGILYNTHHARWRELFGILYQEAFRGSQISKHRKLLHIVYDNKIVSGWMLNLSQTITATDDTMANFSFQFLVRSEFLLANEKELSYNNAYFTGAPVIRDNLDELADLPESDDYLNVARIKPPPKRQRGRGRKTSSYACLPGKGSTVKEGRTKKADPRFKGQQIRAGGPTATDCDVARAALEVLRRRNNEIKKAEDSFKKHKDPARRTKEITNADRKAKKALSTSVANLKARAQIKNQSARDRAQVLATVFGSNLDSLASDPDTLAKYDQKTVTSLRSLIDKTPLDYSSTSEAKK